MIDLIEQRISTLGSLWPEYEDIYFLPQRRNMGVAKLPGSRTSWAAWQPLTLHT